MDLPNQRGQGRRVLFKGFGKTIVAIAVCRALPDSAFKIGETAYGSVVTYSDINATAVGKTSPILATDLLAGKAVVGKIDEGSHTHTYDVTADQIQQLIAGKVVTLQSSLGSDGSGAHTVTIDPKKPLSKGQTIKVFKSDNGDKLSVRLGHSDQPFIYVEGTEELDAETVKLCLGVAASCQAEGSFKAMELIDDIKDRQIFSSVDRVNISGDTYVNVWAKTKSGADAKIIAKVSK